MYGTFFRRKVSLVFSRGWEINSCKQLAPRHFSFSSAYECSVCSQFWQSVAGARCDCVEFSIGNPSRTWRGEQCPCACLVASLYVRDNMRF